MARNFFNKKFSDYLGEQRALLDIITQFFGATPTPTPTPFASPSPTVSPTPSLTPTLSPTPTRTITPTPTPTRTVTPTVTPSPSQTNLPSPSISVSPTVTPSPTASVTPTRSVTPTPTVTPSPSLTPFASPSVTPSPTVTPSPSTTPAVSEFRFTVNTNITNESSSNVFSFNLPCNGSGYSATVNWGDGNFENISGTLGNVLHVYSTPGVYQIRISGTFPTIYFNNTLDCIKVTSLDQWGTGAWTTLEHGFDGCLNMTYNTTSVPDLSSCTSLAYLFRFNSSNLFNSSVSTWNVSNITDISYTFAGCFNFTETLDAWDTANIQLMVGTFQSCVNFNSDLSLWSTNNVTNMSYLFSGAQSFNFPLASWVTSGVTNFSWMFYKAASFNYDIGNWDTSGIVGPNSMDYMFSGALSFDQDLTLWCVLPIPSEPPTFRENCPLSDGNMPIWGTCPIYPSPTPSPTPSVTATPSVTPSITPSITPSLSPSITPSPTITPSISPSITPSITPSLTPSETPNSSTMFVAAGQSGNTLGYSYDGDTWYASNNGNSIITQTGFDVKWNGTKWVAGGAGTSGNTLAYSNDGINWSGSTNGNDFIVSADFVGYGTKWIAGGPIITGLTSPNNIILSDDGITWSGSTDSSIFSGSTPHTIKYNGSYYLVGASGGISGTDEPIGISYDGLTWSGTTNANSLFASVFGIDWDGFKWVAVGSGTAKIAYSYDGLNWTQSSNASSLINNGSSVVWNGTKWVAGGTGGSEILIYSFDGDTWSGSTNGNTIFKDSASDGVVSIIWNGSKFIAGCNPNLGGPNVLGYSTDGLTWSGSTNGNSIFTGSVRGIGFKPTYVPPATTPTPTPTVTPSISISPSVTPSLTPSISVSPTPTPTPTPSGGGWTPASFSNLYDWWTAGSGVGLSGSTVTGWTGYSGHTLLPNDSSFLATYSSSDADWNNQPSIKFNPNLDSEDCGYIYDINSTDTNDATIIIVAKLLDKLTSAGSGLNAIFVNGIPDRRYGFFGAAGSAEWGYYSQGFTTPSEFVQGGTGYTNGNYMVLRYSLNNSTGVSKFYQSTGSTLTNEVQEISGSSGAEFNLGNITIGSYVDVIGAVTPRMTVVEFVKIDGIPSGTEITNMQTYINTKYGI